MARYKLRDNVDINSLRQLEGISGIMQSTALYRIFNGGNVHISVVKTLFSEERRAKLTLDKFSTLNYIDLDKSTGIIRPNINFVINNPEIFEKVE